MGDNLPLVGQIRKRPSAPLPGVKFPRIQGVAWKHCCRTNAGRGREQSKDSGGSTPDDASEGCIKKVVVVSSLPLQDLLDI